MNLQSNCPRLSKPEIVGYMSVDQERRVHCDLTELKYVTQIPSGRISYDLNHNIDRAIKRTTQDNVEKIDLLLKYLKDQGEKLPSDAHIIAYRRTFISVMCSAFDIEPITIVGCLLNGVIYLCSLDRPEVEHRKLNRSDQEKTFCAWGYKFEQFMAADSPKCKPDISKPVVENAEFSLIIQALLGKHKLLYGAQIDGMLATDGDIANPPDTADYDTNIQYLRKYNYVELKTNRELEYRRQEENYKRRKLLSCFGQCYLAGLSGLIVGFRNDQGIVRSLQWYAVDDIVKYCRGWWNPDEALNYLDYFLTYVKDTYKSRVHANASDFRKEGPISLRFERDTKRNITVSDSEDNEILPDWFVDHIRNKNIVTD